MLSFLVVYESLLLSDGRFNSAASTAFWFLISGRWSVCHIKQAACSGTLRKQPQFKIARSGKSLMLRLPHDWLEVRVHVWDSVGQEKRESSWGHWVLTSFTRASPCSHQLCPSAVVVITEYLHIYNIYPFLFSLGFTVNPSFIMFVLLN